MRRGSASAQSSTDVTPLAKLLVGTATTVGAVGAASAMWVAIGRGPSNVQNQSSQSRPSRQSRQGGGASGSTVVVCVTSDSLLRAVSGGSCPSGQTVLNVDCVGCGSQRHDQDARHLKEELADLRRRLDAVHKSSLFTVVDKDGAPIFSVGEDRATVSYSSTTEAWIGGEDGGFGVRSSTERGFAVRLGVPENEPRFAVEEGGLTRLYMGKTGAGSTGRYSLKFPAPGAGGRLAAGIGDSVAHTGAIIVGDRLGNVKASLTANDKGTVGVFNQKGVGVFALTEAQGGGLLAIGGPDGTTMVKMGTMDDRYGVVLAGPRAGFPFVPKSGLPGSYFLGCAGGPSCGPPAQ
jgi:hypothetical protein